jgi:hypothetical protein
MRRVCSKEWRLDVTFRFCHIRLRFAVAHLLFLCVRAAVCWNTSVATDCTAMVNIKGPFPRVSPMQVLLSLHLVEPALASRSWPLSHPKMKGIWLSVFACSFPGRVMQSVESCKVTNAVRSVNWSAADGLTRVREGS